MAKQAFIALLLIIAIWIAPNVKAEAATGRKLVENFQDQKVEELIKLPHNVMVPSGRICYPPYVYDPDCICYANFWPPKPQTYETVVRTMVGKFQDQTVEKLIKLPQRVGVPNQEACYPPEFECDAGCICVSFGPLPLPPPPGPICGRCIGSCA